MSNLSASRSRLRSLVRPVSASACVAVLSCLLLSACGGITIKAAPETSSRNMDSVKATPVAAREAKELREPSLADGLRLARLLRDQGRYEAAVGVYAKLDQNGLLKPLEMLEYASIAAQVQSPQESLTLFGRARRALNTSSDKQSPQVKAALCNGLGRARLALGQQDAALADFECTLAAMPDDTVALNAKAVLLDAQGQHEQARKLLTHANEVDPADARVLNNLALSWLTAGDAERAVRLLSQYSGAPTPSVKLNLAFALTMQGKDAKARETLRSVMPPARVEQAMADFMQRRQRIKDGTPLAQELLAASSVPLWLTERQDRE